MKTHLLGGAAAMALAMAFQPAAPAHAQDGESIVITYKNDVTTLDPAIGYDWQNWSIIKSLFDGLMDYRPGTTELTPDLAESFEVSEDGLTYTFHLRDGVTFHNGRELVAGDVKYSIERVVNPETRSPGAGFYSSIEGFDAVTSGESTELGGIEVVDDRTVRFHLTRPDAPFLHKLALNFAHVVPREAVEEYGADFGRHPVGTGAFRFGEWVSGQRLVLESNPDYYREDLPKLDRIEFQFGLEPLVALLRLQNGEVDIAGDGIPPAKFLEIMGNPDYENNIVQGDQLQTSYLTLNTRVEPFDDLRVREAVNMAINKDRIVRIINGRATPTGQVLPPLMPGYEEGFEGYPYDPEAAREILAEAGYPDGFSTVLYAMNTDPQPRIAQAIQADLAEIGVDVELRTLAQANVIAAGGTEGEAPMVWSGGMAWIADYPDPSNFYWPILGCEAASPGGWNWSWYCNEELEQMAVEADSMADPAKAEERTALWNDIFVQIMEDAPWVPVFNEQRYTIRSDRLTGPEGIFVDPVHIPVHYDYVDVKEGE